MGRPNLRATIPRVRLFEALARTLVGQPNTLIYGFCADWTAFGHDAGRTINIDCQVRQASPGAFWPTPQIIQLQAHDAANQTMIQNTTTLSILPRV
jgi:hypothetical protein